MSEHRSWLDRFLDRFSEKTIDATLIFIVAFLFGLFVLSELL